MASANLEFRFRQVWRTVNDGTSDVRVLALQLWVPAEEWFHHDWKKNGGYWEDIEISMTEPEDNPAYDNSEDE